MKVNLITRSMKHRPSDLMVVQLVKKFPVLCATRTAYYHVNYDCLVINAVKHSGKCMYKML